MARFLVDESLPPEPALLLRADGHDALHVLDLNMRGSSDDAVFLAAKERGAILLSKDLDFSDIRAYPESSGIVVFRFRRRVRPGEVLRLAHSLLREFGQDV